MAFKRPTTTAPAAPPPVEEISFLKPGFYTAGGGLPEGDYIIKDASIVMHSGFGEKKGPDRLGAMITLVGFDRKTLVADTDERKQFYSFGSKAHLSFAPNPNTGKGLVRVPGGPESHSFNDSTNWNMLRKSIFDCDPAVEGLADNDLSIFDGMWAHFTNVPEPAERAGFGNAMTGENAGERKAGTVAIITEVIEGGKPWEGGGGVPEGGKTPTPAPAAKAPTKAAAKAAPSPGPVAEPADDDLMAAALNGVSSVFEQEKYAGGILKILLRTMTFANVKSTVNEATAQAVIASFFNTDANLDTLISNVGYKVDGSKIVPM